MSPLRVPLRGAVSICALVLALPAAISDAGPVRRATLSVQPLRSSIHRLSGLSVRWSRPRHVLLLERAVTAADRIARTPYIYGGGHGSFSSAGYDCSGSVSYVLHAMGRLDVPEDSGDLMSYGEPGPGRHVTIYTNPAHAYMVIDGRRFDTAGKSAAGTRWQAPLSSNAGFVVRHPVGL